LGFGGPNLSWSDLWALGDPICAGEIFGKCSVKQKLSVVVVQFEQNVITTVIYCSAVNSNKSMKNSQRKFLAHVVF